jgi:hypothetical protein
MSDFVPKSKYEELLHDYNVLVQTCNKQQDAYEHLDKYRKTKDKRELFKTRELETEVRRELNDEADRQIAKQKSKLKVA